jgi:hypothetical protein
VALWISDGGTDQIWSFEPYAARIVDPENAYGFYEAFTFSADKEQAKQILHRNGY